MVTRIAKSLWSYVVVLVFICLGASFAPSQSQGFDGRPTFQNEHDGLRFEVWTDKSVYSPSETVLVYGRFKNVGKSRLAISKRQRTDLNVRFFSGAVVVHASPNIVGFLSLRGPSWNTAEKTPEFVDLSPGQEFQYSMNFELSKHPHLRGKTLDVRVYYESKWKSNEVEPDLNLWDQTKGLLFADTVVFEVRE